MEPAPLKKITCHESVPSMELDLPEAFVVYIRTGGCRTFEIYVNGGVSFANLKEYLFNKEGIPPGRMRLIWGGKLLADGETLNCHKITKESTIHMILSLGN